MPLIRATWVITHERPLEPDEDSLAALERPDSDLMLWAYEKGMVTTTVEIIENP